jgi:hypothetical protein
MLTEELKKLPTVGVSLHDEMRVLLLAKGDTTPDRRILYGLSDTTGLLYIPAALRLTVIDTRPLGWFHEHVQPFLPVWVYGDWAESKCEAGVKYKTHYATMPVSAVVPPHYWR